MSTKNLIREGTKKAAHLRPGDFIIPLGGKAEKSMEDNGGIPLDSDMVKVVRKPHPSIASRRKKPLVAVRVDGMDGTEMYMRTPPDTKFAVFS